VREAEESQSNPKDGSEFVTSQLHGTELELPPTLIFGPPDRLGFCVACLQAATTIRSQYQQLWASRDHRTISDPDFYRKLGHLHFMATAVLRRLEGVLDQWQQQTQTVPLTEWTRWDLHESVPQSLLSERSRELLGVAFWYPNLGEYHLMSLGRTAAMILHLLHCDILVYLLSAVSRPSENPKVAGSPEAAALSRSIHGHRRSLNSLALAVVRSIPFAARAEIFGVAPVCFTPSFRVANFALRRECEMLRQESGDGELIRTCEGLVNLVDQHLQWVTGQKIAIKVDFDGSWPRSITRESFNHGTCKQARTENSLPRGFERANDGDLIMRQFSMGL
jgi:hypothetical protein